MPERDELQKKFQYYILICIEFFYSFFMNMCISEIFFLTLGCFQIKSKVLDLQSEIV